MTRRKLLIGLVTTGAFTAGFGAAVLPATADLRTITVTLLSGQTVTVQVDAPATTPLDQLTLPVDGQIASVHEITPVTASPAADPAASTETQTTSTAPASTTPTETTPAATTETTATPDGTTTPVTPADAGAVTGTTPADPAPAADPDPEVTPPALPAPPAAPGAPPTVAAPTAGGTQQSQQTTGSQRRTDLSQDPILQATTAKELEKAAATGNTETPGGVPTFANPTFTEALPGAAPIGVPNFFIDRFRIPPFLLPIYQAAGIQYGVRWEILAAINEIETDYGRNLSVSTAGALGWMQFMPGTWETYGVDANHDGKKDPYNPVDAIFAAARYLKAAGAATDIRQAIFAYNHADWYVDSVLMRARLIGGLPSDLIGSLTGLTQGRFPVDARAIYADSLAKAAYHRRAKGANAAMPVDSKDSRKSIKIFARPGSPLIATQDAKVVKIGRTKRLGHFVQIQDVYGNTYTYGNIGKVADAYGAPRSRTVSGAEVRKELKLPKDPKPTEAASAGRQAATTTPDPVATVGADQPSVEKMRAFANPARPNARAHGGDFQLLADPGDTISLALDDRATFAKALGLKPEEIVVKPFKVGARIAAGTVLGRIGATHTKTAPHVLFEIRPAGKDAPRIDPKPILDGWKLLESTAIYRAAGKNPFFGPDAKNPTIGQILLMSKEMLQRTVLSDPHVEVYGCGREDIRSGAIDRRVLATLEFLAASGLRPTVSSLHCGHGYFTTSGNVSEHSTGSAVDIAAINGIPILGHQGSGSITDITNRRLLTLQGTMKPHQIISLMTYEGADNTLSMPDHAYHIHVGFRPEFDPNSKQARRMAAILKPKQWIKLIGRLDQIENPKVLTSPSKYAIDVKASTHKGD